MFIGNMKEDVMASNTETRYYVLDPRQQSLQGKPEGGWLKEPPAPAVWVRRREQARAFTLEEIEVLKKMWAYLDGCEIVPERQATE
jgi:hypothetical protein